MSVGARLVVSVILLWALRGNAPDFYILLRWLTCLTAGYTAYIALRQGKWLWLAVLGAVALAYNPLAQLHLPRQIWAFVNVGSCILLLASVVAVRDEGAEPGWERRADLARSWLLLGLGLLIAGGLLWWGGEQVLVQTADGRATATVIETWDDVEEGPGDRVTGVVTVGLYEFRVAGRCFTGTATAAQGRISEGDQFPVRYSRLYPGANGAVGDPRPLRDFVLVAFAGGIAAFYLIRDNARYVRARLRERQALSNEPSDIGEPAWAPGDT